MSRERETTNPWFQRELDKEKLTSAAETLEANWDKLDEINKVTSLLALAEFEDTKKEGNYPIVQEVTEKLYSK